MFSTRFKKTCCNFAKNRVHEKSMMAAKMVDML